MVYVHFHEVENAPVLELIVTSFLEPAGIHGNTKTEADKIFPDAYQIGFRIGIMASFCVWCMMKINHSPLLCI